MWIKGGRKSALRGRLALTVWFAVVAVPSATAQLAPTDIGNLGGGAAAVAGVANGFITGNSRTSSGATHAFLWSAATKSMQDLGVLPGTDSSNGFNVNTSGEVVGRSSFFDYNTYAYTAHAFYWSAATGMIRINTISNAGWNGPNLVINDAGVVAGVDANGNVYRWTLAGGIQNLGQACTDQTLVTAINARGDIIGNSGNPGSPGASACAFFAPGSSNTLSLLSSPGLSSPPTNLGYTENFGEVFIAANGLNDSGVVVGTYYDYGVIYYGYAVPLGGFYSAVLHNSHAFMWTSDGGFVELPGFPGAQDPYQPDVFRTNSSANAVNNAGQIVGTSNGPAFLYDMITSQLTQLGSLFSYDPSGVGTGLNDDGVIVGNSGSYWGSRVTPAMWQSGIPTDLTQSFAPLYPGAPLIKGSRIAGGGFDTNWNTHAWTFALPSAAPPENAIFLPGVNEIILAVQNLSPSTGDLGCLGFNLNVTSGADGHSFGIQSDASVTKSTVSYTGTTSCGYNTFSPPQYTPPGPETFTLSPFAFPGSSVCGYFSAVYGSTAIPAGSGITYYRKTFTLPDNFFLDHADLRVGVDNAVAVYINGKRIAYEDDCDGINWDPFQGPLLSINSANVVSIQQQWDGLSWTEAAPSPAVDCVVASLGFDTCSASCGGGTQTEILSVITPAANGGAACRAPATQACNTQSCDSDGDGVVDANDLCPGTAAGAKVDSAGCSGAQAVTRACPTGGSYKNHGAYVSCVAKAAGAAVLSGLITEIEKGAIVSAAAKADIGKK